MHINNKTIEYDQFGAGEPMLLIHGLGGTSNFWRPVATAFGDSFNIIVPDLPGAGGSSLNSDLSIESLAADMLAMLDALELTSVRLVGHSMGTIVCQHMAAQAPERVADLVMLGPLAEPPEPARAALAARAQAARTDGMRDIADTIAEVALAGATKAAKPNVQGFVREMLLRQPPEGYASSCEALGRASRAEANKITARTLLITGDEDGVAPPQNVRDLAKALPNAEVHILESCGHWTLTEKPTEVVNLMRAFYKRTGQV